MTQWQGWEERPALPTRFGNAFDYCDANASATAAWSLLCLCASPPVLPRAWPGWEAFPHRSPRAQGAPVPSFRCSSCPPWVLLLLWSRELLSLATSAQERRVLAIRAGA